MAALLLSFELAFWTALSLIIIGMPLAYVLVHCRFFGRMLLEACVTMPLVLPPTVLGFYFLVFFGHESAAGKMIEAVFGTSLVFTFSGLLVASILYSLPFAVQPMQRAFEAVPNSVRDAAIVLGAGFWKRFLRVELPLAWPGVFSALVMAFSHTLGEFGVVLMVGGNIPGETQTASLLIYDHVQSFNEAAAHGLSLVLLLISMLSILAMLAIQRRIQCYV